MRKHVRIPLALVLVAPALLVPALAVEGRRCCAGVGARGVVGPTGSCPAEAVVPEDRGLRAIRQRVRAAVAADSAVSLAIAVVAGDELVWDEAVGLADRERAVPATPGTPYAIASVTKVVTATAIMRLVERGALEPGRPVNDPLPEPGLQGPAEWSGRVTVRDLLQHAGGLPSHFHFLYEDEAYARPPMDETIRRYAIVVQPPRRRPVYSNLGYGILERVIEIVDGRDYATFLREEVFEPLALDATVGAAVERAGDAGTCRPAVRYAYYGSRLPDYDFDHRGASAIVATAGAIARFGASHFDRPPAAIDPVLGPATRRAMRADTLTTPDGSSRGLGWRVRRHATGATVVEHSGGMPGTLSMLRVAPRARVSVFAVSNSETSALPAAVSAAVLDTLLGRAAAGGLDGAPGPPASPAPSRGSGDIPASASPAALGPRRLSGRWCGTLATWRARRPLELRISGSGDSARAAWPGVGEPLAVQGFQADERGRVTGTIGATIDTPDAARAPHYVRLELFVTGDSLSGAAIAMAVPPVSERVRYGLPSRVTLRRDCP